MPIILSTKRSPMAVRRSRFWTNVIGVLEGFAAGLLILAAIAGFAVIVVCLFPTAIT